jgi:hypothetical protein
MAEEQKSYGRLTEELSYLLVKSCIATSIGRAQSSAVIVHLGGVPALACPL